MEGLRLLGAGKRVFAVDDEIGNAVDPDASAEQILALNLVGRPPFFVEANEGVCIERAGFGDERELLEAANIPGVEEKSAKQGIGDRVAFSVFGPIADQRVRSDRVWCAGNRFEIEIDFLSQPDRGDMIVETVCLLGAAELADEIGVSFHSAFRHGRVQLKGAPMHDCLDVRALGERSPEPPLADEAPRTDRVGIDVDGNAHGPHYDKYLEINDTGSSYIVSEVTKASEISVSLGNIRNCLINVATAAIAALICSTSAVAAAGGAWILDPRSGCRVWNLFPLPNETVRWLGECRDGKAEGRGKLHWTLNGRPNGYYEGYYAAGIRSGPGTFYFQNGNRHTGIYKSDLPNGHGEFVYANGNRYAGDFRNGAFHGKGAFHFSNGDRYVGDFVKNIFHGQGTFTRRDGYSITGQFRNGHFVPYAADLGSVRRTGYDYHPGRR